MAKPRTRCTCTIRPVMCTFKKCWKVDSFKNNCPLHSGYPVWRHCPPNPLLVCTLVCWTKKSIGNTPWINNRGTSFVIRSNNPFLAYKKSRRTWPMFLPMTNGPPWFVICRTLPNCNSRNWDKWICHEPLRKLVNPWSTWKSSSWPNREAAATTTTTTILLPVVVQDGKGMIHVCPPNPFNVWPDRCTASQSYEASCFGIWRPNTPNNVGLPFWPRFEAILDWNMCVSMVDGNWNGRDPPIGRILIILWFGVSTTIIINNNRIVTIITIIILTIAWPWVKPRPMEPYGKCSGVDNPNHNKCILRLWKSPPQSLSFSTRRS